jgi:hypothetical protein
MKATTSPIYRWRVGEVEITRVVEFEAALFEPAVIHPEASPKIIEPNVRLSSSYYTSRSAELLSTAKRAGARSVKQRARRSGPALSWGSAPTRRPTPANEQ